MRNILEELYNNRKLINNKYNKKGITNKIYSKIKDKKIKKYSINLMKYYRNNISYKSMRELAIAYNELKNIECNKYNNITKFDNIYNRYLNLSSLKLIMGDKYFVINLSIKNPSTVADQTIICNLPSAYIPKTYTRLSANTHDTSYSYSIDISTSGVVRIRSTKYSANTELRLNASWLIK